MKGIISHGKNKMDPVQSRNKAQGYAKWRSLLVFAYLAPLRAACLSVHGLAHGFRTSGLTRRSRRSRNAAMAKTLHYLMAGDEQASVLSLWPSSRNYSGTSGYFP